jgi:hypothetical protein
MTQEAYVLRRLCVGATTEVQEKKLRYIKRTVTTEGVIEKPIEEIKKVKVDVQKFAEAGDVIDVSSWANIGAYINAGYIQLLIPPEVAQAQAQLLTPDAPKEEAEFDLSDTIKDLLAQVGDDKEAAERLLDAESAQDHPRVTLVDKLNHLLAESDEDPDNDVEGEESETEEEDPQDS